LARTFALLGPPLPMKCPACGVSVGWKHASAHVQFLCPHCHQGLKLRPAYFRIVNVVSLIAAGLLAYGYGLRRDNVIWGVLVGVFPVQVILLNISLRIFPPDVELTGDFRGILYGDSDERSRSNKDPS
jgi:hypothetical protein